MPDPIILGPPPSGSAAVPLPHHPTNATSENPRESSADVAKDPDAEA